MDTNSSSAESVMQHRRVIYPAPSGPLWRMDCSCGWCGSVKMEDCFGMSVGEIMDELNRIFVEHVPLDDRSAYVKVDRRAGMEGQWLMPEGIPCAFGRFFETADGWFVEMEHPERRTIIVGEVITEDGQVLRLD